MHIPFHQHIARPFMFAALALAATTPAHAGDAPVAQPPAVHRDGQHDFDFHIGRWKTQLRRLVEPLSGSTAWLEYEGTTVVREVLGGRANLVELVANGAADRFEGMSLRLYNPQSRQWSLNFANAGNGVLTQPAIGEFHGGRGEFYDQEEYRGRAILVRFVIVRIDDDTVRFEQAYSDDGGRSWELNWVATDTRIE